MWRLVMVSCWLVGAAGCAAPEHRPVHVYQFPEASAPHAAAPAAPPRAPAPQGRPTLAPPREEVIPSPEPVLETTPRGPVLNGPYQEQSEGPETAPPPARRNRFTSREQLQYAAAGWRPAAIRKPALLVPNPEAQLLVPAAAP